jgi:hypothetical protein
MIIAVIMLDNMATENIIMITFIFFLIMEVIT